MVVGESPNHHRRSDRPPGGSGNPRTVGRLRPPSGASRVAESGSDSSLNPGAILRAAMIRPETAEFGQRSTGAVTMGMSRKKALERLNGLAPRVEEHLAKVAENPASRNIRHWTAEIGAWIRQMEDVIPHVGGKTSEEWRARIAEWKSKLENAT
jgi:pyruvoyl-dependent arginine decarboxylase (PvlArgDC)